MRGWSEEVEGEGTTRAIARREKTEREMEVKVDEGWEEGRGDAMEKWRGS